MLNLHLFVYRNILVPSLQAKEEAAASTVAASIADGTKANVRNSLCYVIGHVLNLNVECKAEMDIVTHLAICESQNWGKR